MHCLNLCAIHDACVCCVSLLNYTRITFWYNRACTVCGHVTWHGTVTNGQNTGKKWPCFKPTTLVRVQKIYEQHGIGINLWHFEEHATVMKISVTLIPRSWYWLSICISCCIPTKKITWIHEQIWQKVVTTWKNEVCVVWVIYAEQKSEYLSCWDYCRLPKFNRTAEVTSDLHVL